MPSADPVLILQPTSPPVLIAPITTPPVVIGVATGGGTLTGGGSAGEVAVWDGSTDLTGDAALLWDATNQSLSVTTANVNGGIVSTNTVVDGGVAVKGTADNVDGTGVQGNSAGGWGVQGTTGDGSGVFGLATAANGWGVQGTATGSGGIAVRAETGHAAAVGIQVKQPAGATANSAEGYLNFVLQWAILVAGGAYFTSAALSTSATSGFLGIPSCAGVPTGVPSGYPAGVIPMVYDTTDDKLYIYRSGWKASGVFT